MTFKDLVGKTIISAVKQKLVEYDDTGFLKLQFSDGTSAVIVGSYSENHTGKSENEYPTTIVIVKEYYGELVDMIQE